MNFTTTDIIRCVTRQSYNDDDVFYCMMMMQPVVDILVHTRKLLYEYHSEW